MLKATGMFVQEACGKHLELTLKATGMFVQEA
jgi:hypothetical protein